MQTENGYTKLAEYLSCLGMGYPLKEELVASLSFDSQSKPSR